jgi:hypothetical protein
LNNQ